MFRNDEICNCSCHIVTLKHFVVINNFIVHFYKSLSLKNYEFHNFSEMF